MLSEPFNAYFDPDKLDKILYNLLSNASKYSRHGGMISIRLTCMEENLACLVVKDNGPGIAKEAQKTFLNVFTKEITGSLKQLELVSDCR